MSGGDQPVLGVDGDELLVVLMVASAVVEPGEDDDTLVVRFDDVELVLRRAVDPELFRRMRCGIAAAMAPRDRAAVEDLACRLVAAARQH